MSDERKHHPFGCSKWPDLLRCADYKATEGSSPAAERGTRIHKLWELVGTNQDIPKGSDPEELSHAVWAAEVIDEMSDAATCEWETKIESHSPEYFGHADVIWQSDHRTLHIADGKSGQGNPEQYIQLIGYAFALLQELAGIEQVELHFVYWDKRQTSSFQFSRADVLNTVEEFLTHVSSGKRGVGVQCNRCQNYEGCSEVKGILFRSWQTDWELVWQSPESVASLKADLDFLMSMKDKATEKIKAWVDEGTIVPGYKTFTRKGSSKVLPAQAWQSLKGEIDADEFLECCSVNLKKLQSLYQLRTGRELEGTFIKPGKPTTMLRKTK